MAKNYVQDGNVLTVIAPANVTSGKLIKVGAIVGVALFDALAGEPVEVRIKGVWSLPKTSAQAWAQGDPIYLLTGGNVANASATGAVLVGFATEAAANPSPTGIVCLNGVGAPAAAA